MVQSFPPLTSTMTMLQTRPSPSDPYQSGSQGQQHQRNAQMPRNIYNTSVGGMAAGNYRGQTSTSPVSPYGFQNAPILHNGPNPLRQHPTASQHPRLENQTAYTPSIPIMLQAQQQNFTPSNRPQPIPANPTFSTPNTFPSQQQISKDDVSIPTNPNTKQPISRPLSTLDLNPPTLPTASYATVAKSSPDRYRRNHRRAETSGALSTSNSVQGGSAMPSGSGMAAVGNLYTHPTQSSSSPSLNTYRGAPSSTVNDYSPASQPRIASKDDLNLQRERQASSDLAKRYRRRSISSLEAKDFAMSESQAPPQQPAQPKSYAAMLAGPSPTLQATSQERREVRASPAVERPTSSHGRNGSNESTNSGRSAPKAASVRYITIFGITSNTSLVSLTLIHSTMPHVSTPKLICSFSQSPSNSRLPHRAWHKKPRQFREMKQSLLTFLPVALLRPTRDRQIPPRCLSRWL